MSTAAFVYMDFMLLIDLLKDLLHESENPPKSSYTFSSGLCSLYLLSSFLRKFSMDAQTPMLADVLHCQRFHAMILLMAFSYIGFVFLALGGGEGCQSSDEG
jgi:hypothetical protein